MEIVNNICKQVSKLWNVYVYVCVRVCVVVLTVSVQEQAICQLKNFPEKNGQNFVSDT